MPGPARSCRHGEAIAGTNPRYRRNRSRAEVYDRAALRDQHQDENQMRVFELTDQAVPRKLSSRILGGEGTSAGHDPSRAGAMPYHVGGQRPTSDGRRFASTRTSTAVRPQPGGLTVAQYHPHGWNTSSRSKRPVTSVIRMR
jgi:hypothetical protein